MYQDGSDCAIQGLHAAGEAVSNCHGANRLGANSILDVIIFGKALADNISKICKPGDRQPQLRDVSINHFTKLKNRTDACTTNALISDLLKFFNKRLYLRLLLHNSFLRVCRYSKCAYGTLN